MIGGLRGSSGKTAVTLGIIGALKKMGIEVGAFKKGPDYIDAAWHAVATQSPCYCLDVFMMGEGSVVRQFARKAPPEGVAVIEGNRGLFDGFDKEGSYSTAALSKLLDAPLILVVDAAKMTRTAAALVTGCMQFDPSLRIKGVILNRVAGTRHREMAVNAVESSTGVPVLGCVPRLSRQYAPERHLGLVTPEETPDARLLVEEVSEEISGHLDGERIKDIALSAGRFEPDVAQEEKGFKASAPIRIGVVRDSAFPFYYFENLEALTNAGAQLVWINSIDDPELPDIHALYLGGGFPETHAAVLSARVGFKESLKKAVDSGLPVYAECGGSIFLGRRLYYRGECFEMAGILPVDYEFCKRPQAHGYTFWRVDFENPFYRVGELIRGHEFHYTRVREWNGNRPHTAVKVERGVGFGDARDGIRVGNVVAFYGHVHALGCPEWAEGMVRAAERYAEGR